VRWMEFVQDYFKWRNLVIICVESLGSGNTMVGNCMLL
jgi:hypothetical protein